MIENTNTKQFYPGPILNNTLEITDFLFNDAEQIKITHSKLNEEGILVDVDLNYPTDYEVTKVLPSDINAAEAALTASTGQVLLKNVTVLAGEKLTVYRLSQIIQDKDYPRTGAFPAATHEGALDYLTMQNQEQREEIARSLKVPISTPNFNAAVPVPLPNRILRINNDAAGFEFVPYDLDERLDTFEDTIEETIVTNQAKIEADFNSFKVETNNTLSENKTELEGIIADNRQEVLDIQSDYQEEMDLKFQTVSDAADKINELETAVDTAVAAATTAVESVQNIEETSDQLKEEIIQEAETQLENIKSTGFYMRNDNLYFINSKGEEEEFRAGGGLPMFAPIWSDHMYNDVSYLRADNFSWHDADIYITAYAKLVEQYNHENSVEMTDGTVTYKLTPDGFRIANADQHDNIRYAYDDNGKAWYYLLDEGNGQFKLPREKKTDGKYLYFYVGQYERPTTEVNIGILTELANGTDISVITQEINEIKDQAIAEVQATGLDGLQAQIDSLKAEINTMLGRMDFANVEQFDVSGSKSYTCPSDGYVQWAYAALSSNDKILVNGKVLYQLQVVKDGLADMLFVSSGDVITVTSGSVSGTFIPQKGV
ncbi:MAG: hypothetical protein IKU15_07340 [Clostridia bacterium]|nr:hypothetical protein [Clostridia bacterium]